MISLEPVVSEGIRYVHRPRPGSQCNVLLLHGIGTSLEYWAPVLALLPDTLTILCPDVPGSGWSQFTGDRYDIATIARQLADFVDTQLEGSTVLVGHSLGALVVIEMAAQRPRCYTRLLLVDPVLFDVERVLTDLPAFLASPRLSIRVLSQLAGVIPSGHLSATILKSPLLRRVLLADQVGDGARVDPEVLATCLAGTRGWPHFKVLQVLWAARRVHLAERLGRVQTPFTVIRGSQDPLSTPADLARLATFDGFEGVVDIDATGHSPMLDKAPQLAEAILDACGG